MNIKSPLSMIMIVASTASALGQGALQWGNSFTGFRAPIYGYDPADPGWIRGQSALGVPSGTTVYGGPLLQGTGYTFGVYIGPVGTPENSLIMLTSTTFRTATGNKLPAGLVFGGTATIPGVQAGQPVEFQIRVWDNRGGTIQTWEEALQTHFELTGESAITTTAPLGGIGTDGTPYATPGTVGWTSFNIYWIPEPSIAALIGLGAVASLILRRERRGK